MGSALNNRRRIMRRGLPYGRNDAKDGEHGVVMLVVCASLQRQFEFVQQQWMNYGLDANQGNDTCPVIGNHGADEKFVIPADPHAGTPPFIATGLKQWVQTRGGDYFFMPSMTALRMIGMGVVDPT
jgi:deferrochelatase/peroxidase EfeB